MDLAFTAEPIRAITLHAVELADDDTSYTRFVDGIAVYRSLPSDLRKRIEPLHARHVLPYQEEAGGAPIDETMPQHVHPLLFPHGETGEPILFITEMMTRKIEELDDAEGHALLQLLFDHLYQPHNIYQHNWRLGDVILWDNYALQHARGGVGTKPRTLQRVIITEKLFAEQWERQTSASEAGNAVKCNSRQEAIANSIRA